MLNKKTLEGMTAAQVAQLLAECKERRITAAVNVNAAIRDYYKAVEKRDTKIEEMKKDVHKQLEAIADEAEALNEAMLKAAIAEDSAKQEEAQQALTDLESQRLQLNARLGFLDGTPPKCDEAYAAMEAAAAESAEADRQYGADIAVIREFCEEAMKPWEEIISSLDDRGEAVNQFSLERIRRKYNGEQSGTALSASAGRIMVNGKAVREIF